MDALVCLLATLGPAASLVLLPVVLRHRRRLASWFETGTPWHDDVLRTAADELGLAFRARRFLQPPAAIGVVDGVRVHLRLFPVLVADQEVLDLELEISGLPRDVRVRRRSNPASSAGARTGDRVFDQGVVFLAPAVASRSWLPAPTRHALEHLVHAGGVVAGGRLRLEHAGPDLLGAAEIVELVRQALRASRGLLRGPVPLREIVASDPELRVRLFALDRLLADPAIDREWLGALAGGDDAVAVRAALALGDDARLVALVDGPAAREALLAVAPRLTTADARIEAAFRRVLREAPDPRLLHHAGRLCSVALVVDLLAVTGPQQRAARAAVAALQARALGERGGLALAAPAGAGDLALAEEAGAGQVALATPGGSPAREARGNLGSREGT